MARRRSASYWEELLSPPAVLGVVAILVQPVLLAIRATDLEHALTMASIADRSLGTFRSFGFSYPVGTCFLTSAALTLAQMVCASLYFVEMPDGERRRSLKILSSAGWALLSLLELAGSIFCSNCQYRLKNGPLYGSKNGPPSGDKGLQFQPADGK